MDQETYLLIEKIVYAICYQMERSLLLEDQIGMVSSLAEDVAQLSNRCAVYSRNTLPSSTSCIKQFCITNLITLGGKLSRSSSQATFAGLGTRPFQCSYSDLTFAL